MVPIDRTRPLRLVALYVAVAMVWAGLARWVVPPLLVADCPGSILAAATRHIQGYATPFTGRDLLGRWFEFSVAVGIAAFLHLTILLMLLRYDRRDAEGRSAADLRAGRHVSRVLAILSFAFLAVTVLTWPRHDYYFYLQMWYEVRQGHDPWWMVFGEFGDGPLNAYGPAFNLLAGLAWLNPLAPKLLFAMAYVLFAVAQIKSATASRRLSGLPMLGLFALFWNPYPWVEIAIQGHFDILVGLSCLAAVHARLRDRDVLSGVSLALGVLLKYLPIVLLPFLALDRGRLRLRVLVVAMASIALGLVLSYELWGISVLRPLTFALNRPSATLSIFRFLRTRYSPLFRLGISTNFDGLSPVIIGLSLLLAWSWSRAQRPNLEASAAVVAATTVLFYRVGFPQYHMVPIVLALSWAVRNWGQLRARTLLGFAIGCYLAWLAAFDVCEFVLDDGSNRLSWDILRDVSGLPMFLFGCLFLTGLVRSSTPARLTCEKAS